jgi:hypothetical protein
VGTTVSEELTTSIFGSEDGGAMFLRNVGAHIQVHTASQPGRPPWNEVDRTGPESCSVADVGISGAEPADSSYQRVPVVVQLVVGRNVRSVFRFYKQKISLLQQTGNAL